MTFYEDLDAKADHTEETDDQRVLFNAAVGGIAICAAVTTAALFVERVIGFDEIIRSTAITGYTLVLICLGLACCEAIKNNSTD